MFRPICFMIMPFGVRQTQLYGQPGPEAIDFDRLWEAAFAPAIRQMGYEPLRADLELGGLLIPELIERLVTSDLVVADVTLPHPMTFYDVGIRHAARETACVLIAADWSRQVFDVHQMRQIRYPLPSQVVDDSTADQIRRTLTENVPRLSNTRSPVFDALPGYPQTGALSSSRNLDRVAAFQAEITEIRSAPRRDRARRAMDLRDRLYSGGPIPAPIALELLVLIRDSTDPQTTLEFIDSLPVEQQQIPSVKEQRTLALSKSGDPVTAITALEELISTYGDTSERRGLLGGRYKRLYAAESDSGHKSTLLDAAIENYEMGMLLDLNDYYPSANLPRLYRLRNQDGDEQRAIAAATVAALACERALRKGSKDEWLRPTLLGAAFDAGDVARARDLAREVRRDGPAAWALKTTIADLRSSVSLKSGETAADLARVLEELEQMAGSR
jgi:hypothetical protein